MTIILITRHTLDKDVIKNTGTENLLGTRMYTIQAPFTDQVYVMRLHI